MYAIVRLRGGVNTRPEIKDTLSMLHLDRINHCVVVREDEHYRGMIQKVKDFVAWGEVDADTLVMLLEGRGRLSGNRRLTDAVVGQISPYRSIKELASAIHSGSANIKEFGIKPIFRLHPPRKGHRGIKKSVKEGGELGYHPSMGDFLAKMR
jgi:large subunit ribosomal protein L30